MQGQEQTVLAEALPEVHEPGSGRDLLLASLSEPRDHSGGLVSAFLGPVLGRLDLEHSEGGLAADAQPLAVLGEVLAEPLAAVLAETERCWRHVGNADLLGRLAADGDVGEGFLDRGAKRHLLALDSPLRWPPAASRASGGSLGYAGLRIVAQAARVGGDPRVARGLVVNAGADFPGAIGVLHELGLEQRDEELAAVAARPGPFERVGHVPGLVLGGDRQLVAVEVEDGGDDDNAVVAAVVPGGAPVGFRQQLEVRLAALLPVLADQPFGAPVGSCSHHVIKTRTLLETPSGARRIEAATAMREVAT